jgi:hypothetical protein
MCLKTEAPSSWACLVVNLLGVAVAIPARCLILGAVMGWGSLVVFVGGLLAIVISIPFVVCNLPFFERPLWAYLIDK